MDPKVYKRTSLEYQKQVVFVKMEMENFTRIKKYFTEGEACFMFIDEGSFVLRTPEETIAFNSGEGLIVKCGNYLLEQGNKDVFPIDNFSFLAVYLYPSVIKELFTGARIPAEISDNYDVKKIKMDTLFSDFYKNISFLLENPEIVDDTLVLLKLKEFILLLSKTDKAQEVADYITSLFNPYLYSFQKIIENNTYTNLSLTEFAFLCGMSLTSFKRKFKTYYKVSPKQFLLDKKIEKATELLPVKEHRIADIAYDCGFESINSFNRNFKKYTGKTPTAYRKQVLE